MNLKRTSTADLDWRFDFSPRATWPKTLPVMAVEGKDALQVVAGFDRKEQKDCDVLILDKSAPESMESLHTSLGTFEKLRFDKVLLAKDHDLLRWPLDFQNYADDRQLSLKMLRPLAFLTPWMDILVKTALSLRPSTSQLREILDLCCDLQMGGLTAAAFPQMDDGHTLIKELKKLRFPQSSATDSLSAQNLLKIPWPRGLQARWERQGDTAGIVIQTKVSTEREWNQLKENIKNLQVPEDVWKN